MAADTTYRPLTYRRAGGDETVIASGGKLIVESGGTIEVESGGLLTIADGAIAAADVALAEGNVLVGNSAGKGVALSAKTDANILLGDGTTLASVAMSGHVKIVKSGATTIQAKAVANTMIAAAAGTVLVGTKTSGDVTTLDNSAAGAIVIGQGAGETCIAAALTGDITMTKAGLTAIGAGKVTSAMWSDGSGVAAVLTAGLGGSAAVVKTDTATKTVVAADGAKARAVLVIATVTEAFATNTGTRTLVKVGETDTLDLLWGNTAFPNAMAINTVITGAFTNTSTKAITLNAVAAVGDGTGGVAVVAVAIPTT